MYGCESWTIKKAEHRRIDAFELWCWRRLLRVSWTAGRSNQSILKEISLEYSLEGLMLKLQYFGHLMQRTDSFEKTLMLGKIEGRRRRGRQRMRWLDGITEQWTWVWVGSGSWWWTGRPGVLQSMGSQRARHNWTTELTDWTGLYSPWNSLGQNTGVGSLLLLQGNLTNPGLPHCGQILYQLSHRGSPRILGQVAYPFSMRSSWPRNRTRVSSISGGFFTNRAIRETKNLTLVVCFLLSLSQFICSVSDSLRPHRLAARQDSLSITNSQSLLKLMSIESVIPSNHLLLCRPLLLPPSIFPSTRVFSNESALRIRWPKYWSFSFSISPYNE